MKSTILAGYMLLTLGVAGFVPHDPSGRDPAQRIEIVAKRFEFAPADVTLAKGVPVTLSFTSKDADHGVRFDGLDVVLKAKKNETREITFTPDQAGTFIGRCNAFCGEGHGSMKLTLHVTD